ncbi:MAG: hypothetical protein ACKV2Q_18780 [Planctomycetaceae bacterium]
MSAQNPSGMNRRAACRRLLGLASSVPLAASWLGGVQSTIGASEADSLGNTIRIEEDWYVKIGTPDPESDSPQITSVIAPSWTLTGKYAVFDLNCATQPGFVAGGVQLQLWQDDQVVQTRSNVNWDSLHLIDEEIRYTSVISVIDGKLVFEIINGSSESWGSFGTGELKLEVDTWRSHLNQYSPEFTVENSRIGFASHRVRRFTLERIRYFSAHGLQSTDDMPRVLHQYDPQA